MSLSASLRIIQWMMLMLAASADAADNFGDQPRVETPIGTFYGSYLSSARQSRTLKVFTGIPYAKPPTGPLRFTNPVKYGPHSAPFNATKPAPECIQWDHLLGRGVVGSEDCLYLNVYTNKVPEPPYYYNTQPVMVFMHAGTWLAGAGASDLFLPDYFVECDVTLITVNSRLGPFGFLSTEDTEAPGNYGMMDQVMALEWIRDYSRYFGGMNDSVTVMGSGAGGVMAHLMTLTPKTRGASTYPDEYVLIHRAASHSGTAYGPRAISRDAKAVALKFAYHLGCPGTSSEEMIRCMRAISATKMVEQIPLLFEWDEEPMPFGPVIDTWMGDDAFLPDEPHHLIKQKRFLNIPWIAGTNKDDGAFRVRDILKDPSLVKQLNTNWEKFGPILLNLNDACKDPVAIANMIRKYYMKNKKFGDESARNFVEMMTDRFFTYPTDQAMRDQCYKLRGHKTYCYRYELVACGRKSFLDILHKENPNELAASTFGAGISNPRFQIARDAHGWGVSFLDELLYLFPSSKLDFMYKQDFHGDSTSRISTHMGSLWTNFAKGGDPTPMIEGWPEDVSPWGMWWEPFVKGYMYYLKIDEEMETQVVPLRDAQMAFWSDLPLFENRDKNIIRDEL